MFMCERVCGGIIVESVWITLITKFPINILPFSSFRSFKLNGTKSNIMPTNLKETRLCLHWICQKIAHGHSSIQEKCVCGGGACVRVGIIVESVQIPLITKLPMNLLYFSSFSSFKLNGTKSNIMLTSMKLPGKHTMSPGHPCDVATTC